MDYSIQYQTPIGQVTLASNTHALTGLWFSGQKYDNSKYCYPLPSVDADPVLRAAVQWLDAYWQKRMPSPSDIPIAFHGSDFRIKIWQLLLQIPYGSCITYGELAQQYCVETGSPAMSAQAVGSAVGRNPISIIIPCHRVIGSKGSMTGYAGGIDRKIALLSHEDISFL